MNVHEISRLHDRAGHFEMSELDPSEQAPIPIVDMLFSQPILLGCTGQFRSSCLVQLWQPVSG
jgi:hypothetical protein